MSQSFEPLHDRVLVLRDDAAKQTPGGIHIPDTVDSRQLTGVVIAVGPGRRDETGRLVPASLKPQDRILFDKYTGSLVTLDGVEHVVMREQDVYGVLR